MKKLKVKITTETDLLTLNGKPITGQEIDWFEGIIDPNVVIQMLNEASLELDNAKSMLCRQFVSLVFLMNKKEKK